MKSAACFFLLGFVASPLGAAPSASTRDEAAIRDVERTLCEAIRTGDAETIARLEDETHTLTNTRAEVSSRAADIADAKKGETRYSEFRNHDTLVRLYGDAAIVLGITSLKGTSSGKSFELNVRFTDTYVRRAGGWKIAASHATRLDKK
ncbi:MAG TPA: nuclear transport factor 2 family protein [Rhodanobacteraceae bacterium]|jgi:ketosteroid isomerase-like protein|nr:nuclear transport factor 2 family protein [Rhodanobacteraceae bacterium]